MQFTVDVPDDLIADALAAWAALRARKGSEQIPEITIDNAWARAVLVTDLGRALLSNTHEVENDATNTATQAVQLRIAQAIQAAAPVEP